MSQLLRLSDYRCRQPIVHFERGELSLLLGLYSRRVAAGEWRDYAIDTGPGRAVFAVFRSAQERPLFMIVKSSNGRYTLTRGAQRLHESASLGDVLAVFDTSLRLVT